MRVVKRQSTKTYKDNKSQKERHYYNYYLECDNGKRVLIRPVNTDDYSRLDMVAEYER